MKQLTRRHYRDNGRKCFRTLCFLDGAEFNRWVEFKSEYPLVAQFWQRRKGRTLIHIPVHKNTWMIVDKSKVSIRYIHHYAKTI